MLDLLQALVDSGFNRLKIMVHGRADIASLSKIPKVQLPGHGVPLPLVKEYFPNISFGRSVHSFREAEIAINEGADWLLYGHLFTTNSKEGLPPRGTKELYRITASTTIPVYAIGGIKPEHLPRLQQAGIAGVAVMSSIFGSDNSVQAAQAYKEGRYVTTR